MPYPRFGIGGRAQTAAAPIETITTAVETTETITVRAMVRVRVPSGTTTATVLRMVDAELAHIGPLVRQAVRQCREPLTTAPNAATP